MSYAEKLKAYEYSLPEITEEPHFQRLSFRIHKKIFATYDEHKQLVTVRLSAINQDVFVTMGKNYIYPVPNKWGK